MLVDAFSAVDGSGVAALDGSETHGAHMETAHTTVAMHCSSRMLTGWPLHGTVRASTQTLTIHWWPDEQNNSESKCQAQFSRGDKSCQKLLCPAAYVSTLLSNHRTRSRRFMHLTADTL